MQRSVNSDLLFFYEMLYYLDYISHHHTFDTVSIGYISVRIQFGFVEIEFLAIAPLNIANAKCKCCGVW